MQQPKIGLDGGDVQHSIIHTSQHNLYKIQAIPGHCSSPATSKIADSSICLAQKHIVLW
jgi:hypothetical protein